MIAKICMRAYLSTRVCGRVRVLRCAGQMKQSIVKQLIYRVAGGDVLTVKQNPCSLHLYTVNDVTAQSK